MSEKMTRRDLPASLVPERIEYKGAAFQASFASNTWSASMKEQSPQGKIIPSLRSNRNFAPRQIAFPLTDHRRTPMLLCRR